MSQSESNRANKPAIKPSSIAIDRFLIGLLLLVISYVMIFSWGVDRGREKGARAAHMELSKLKAEVKELSRMTEELRQAPVPASPVFLAPSVAAPRMTTQTSTLSEKPAPPTRAVARTIEGEDGSITMTAAPVMREEAALPASASASPGKYTIQLVTYNTQSRAEQQLAALKAQGFDPFIIPSGSYFQICINRFPTKDLARSMQKRIQSETGKYPDAYIRNLPSL